DRILMLCGKCEAARCRRGPTNGATPSSALHRPGRDQPPKKHLPHRLVKKVLVHDRRTVEIWYGLPNQPSVRTPGNLAPRVGFEPTTLRLTAGCSTIELPRNELGRVSRGAAARDGGEAGRGV